MGGVEGGRRWAGTWAAGEREGWLSDRSHGQGWGELAVTGQKTPHARRRAGIPWELLGLPHPPPRSFYVTSITLLPSVRGAGGLGFLGRLVAVSVGAGTVGLEARDWDCPGDAEVGSMCFVRFSRSRYILRCPCCYNVLGQLTSGCPHLQPMRAR